MGKIIRIAGILVVAGFAGSCASPVTEQAKTGFISDYSALQMESDTSYKFSSPKFSEYSSFLIEDPIILFNRDAGTEGSKFSDAEIDDLVAYYKQHLTEAISKDYRYKIVDQPGAGVARIRVALTAIDKSDPLLNVSIYTKFTGAGLGGAAMEREIQDSTTGEQLHAAVEWGNGSRFLRAGLTKLGGAKLQIDKWTKDLRTNIDASRRS